MRVDGTSNGGQATDAPRMEPREGQVMLTLMLMLNPRGRGSSRLLVTASRPSGARPIDGWPRTDSKPPRAKRTNQSLKAEGKP